MYKKSSVQPSAQQAVPAQNTGAAETLPQLSGNVKNYDFAFGWLKQSRGRLCFSLGAVISLCLFAAEDVGLGFAYNMENSACSPVTCKLCNLIVFIIAESY